MVICTGFRDRQAWDGILALPLTCWVTWATQILGTSVSHLENVDDTYSYLLLSLL